MNIVKYRIYKREGENQSLLFELNAITFLCLQNNIKCLGGFDIPTLSIYRFENGKIKETWGESNNLEVMMQLDFELKSKEREK